MEKYFDFNGKVSRAEYWATLVLSFIIYIILAAIGGITLGISMALLNIELVDSQRTSALVWVPLFIVLMWIWIATGVKRCRDADMNPLWLIASVIPALSFIVLVVVGVMPTKKDSSVA